MDQPIVVAVIGGVCTVVSPILTLLATRLYDQRFLLPLGEGRRKALDGKWQGTFHQEVGPDGKPLDADYSLQLVTSRKTVKGEGSSHFELGGKKYEPKFFVAGGLIHERFLRFTYDNVDATCLQFGSMVLELLPDGRTLRGRFVAFGQLSQRLIYGSIELTKQA
jgi:hypothetical protein